jgi:hypothetical protein
MSTSLTTATNFPQAESELNRDFLSRKGYLLLVMFAIIELGRLNEEERKKLRSTQLLYGVGEPGVYGVCIYDKWVRDGIQDVIQISAFQGVAPHEMWVTMTHELAHVLAGDDAAHGAIWKADAKRLGLSNPKAVGAPRIEDLSPDLVAVLNGLPLPTEGDPLCDEEGSRLTPRNKGCKIGIGKRRGQTRGPGTGRLRLWICDCARPRRVRIASDKFNARCLDCFSLFRRDGTVPATGTALIKWEGPANGGSFPAHDVVMHVPCAENRPLLGPDCVGASG